MKNMLDQKSPFRDLKGIEYFCFEEDFVEKNIRCIPMIVRFKMDAVGIKLKLSEWNRFSTQEKIELATMTDDTVIGGDYHLYLANLIKKYTGQAATALSLDNDPEWNRLDNVPYVIRQKAEEFDWTISNVQWRELTDLQRFALLKLCRPGHENKNFPKAMKEFNLTPENLLN